MQQPDIDHDNPSNNSPSNNSLSNNGISVIGQLPISPFFAEGQGSLFGDTFTDPTASRLSEWTITSRTHTQLLKEVEELVAATVADNEIFVILINRKNDRFVQFLVDEDEGRILLESVSQEFLVAHPKLSPLTASQVSSLVRDKWMPPTPDVSPNWHRFIPIENSGSIAMASLILVSALVEVHDLERPSDLDVTIDVQ